MKPRLNKEEATLWAKRISTFFGGCILMVLCSPLYGWSSYNHVLKHNMGWSDKTINLISATCGAQALILWVSGLVVDHAGPRLACLWSAALMFIGWMGVFLQYATRYTLSPIPMAISFFVMSVGGGAYHLTGVSITGKNCSAKSRPLVTGLLVTAVGLSGLLLTLIYKHFFAATRDLYGFFLTLGLLMPGAGLLTIPLLFEVEPTSTINSSPDAESKPLMSPVTQQQQPDRGEPEQSSGSEPETDVVVPKKPSIVAATPATAGIDGDDVTGLALLKDERFYLIYLMFLLSTPCGLVYFNNASMVFASNGYSESVTLSYVAVMSVFNSVVRPGFAVAMAGSELIPWRQLKAAINQVFFTLVCIAGLAILLGLLIVQGPVLPLVTIALPIFYGGMFTIYPTLVFSQFGAKHFSFNFGVLSTGAAIGNFLAGQLIGALYDRAAGTSNNCHGTKCFSLGFGICCAIVVFTFFTTLRLWFIERGRILRRIPAVNPIATSIN